MREKRVEYFNARLLLVGSINHMTFSLVASCKGFGSRYEYIIPYLHICLHLAQQCDLYLYRSQDFGFYVGCLNVD